MTQTVTTSEWLQALEHAMASRPVGDEGMTFHEIQGAMGCGRDLVSTALHELKGQGRLIVGHRRVQNIAGKWGSIPVYRIV